jgi:hypothetical protein
MMSAGGPVVDGAWGVERRARNRFPGREHRGEGPPDHDLPAAAGIIHLAKLCKGDVSAMNVTVCTGVNLTYSAPTFG